MYKLSTFGRTSRRAHLKALRFLFRFSLCLSFFSCATYGLPWLCLVLLLFYIILTLPAFLCFMFFFLIFGGLREAVSCTQEIPGNKHLLHLRFV
jgi:hypothetical protein